MKLHKIWNIHPRLCVHPGDERRQERLDHELAVVDDAVCHGYVLISAHSVAVQPPHVLKYVTEADNEILQQLGGVDSEDIVHVIDGHEAELNGGGAQVHQPLVHQVTKFRHTQRLHLEDDG